VKSIYEGGLPEQNPAVARFLDARGNIFAREGKRVFTVLGVDMAHARCASALRSLTAITNYSRTNS
jgi:hypothetical protein